MPLPLAALVLRLLPLCGGVGLGGGGEGVGEDAGDGIQKAEADAGVEEARDQRRHLLDREPVERRLVVPMDVLEKLRQHSAADRLRRRRGGRGTLAAEAGHRNSGAAAGVCSV
uniref:Uncharacterized protein n=1 Tax=Arundo donax TaxID=35708 RepID=A0A0A9C194_ARUDO